MAWLCEIQAVGTTVIKKVMKKYSNAGTVSSKGRQRVGQRAASSSIFENESTPKDKGRKAPKTVDDGSCCHEDGGKYAIFEQFNEVLIKSYFCYSIHQTVPYELLPIVVWL